MQSLAPTRLVHGAPRWRRLQSALEHALTLCVGAGLATATLRYLIPSPDAAPSTSLFGLARVAAEKPVAVWLLLFLGISAALGYWRKRAVLFTRPESQRDATGPREFASFGALMLLAVLAAWFFRGSVAEFYRVDGPSMLPTLEAGDRLLANKLALGFKAPWQPGVRALPQRGDIIVFAAPEPHATDAAPGQLIKRVLGLPGDRIRMRGAQPIINDWDVPSCFVGPYPYINGLDAAFGQLRVEYLDAHAHLALYAADTRAFSGEYLVKPHEVFVLGDNRSNSEDSRSFKRGRGGGVAQALIKGQAARFLTGTSRDASRQGGGRGSASFAEVWQPIDMASLNSDFNLEGMQLAALRQKLEQCLAHPPSETSPPAADAAP